MIPGVTSVPQSLTGGSTPLPTSNSLGKDDFLRLLVAQLAAQDPLDPMSAQDFSAQLAQFSALEQLTNVNVNLEQIKEAEIASSNAAAINLIGKNIESPGNSFNHKAGFPEILSYTLAGDAGLVKVEIFDSTGSLVNSVSLGSQPKGSNLFGWDGFDSQDKEVASGTYSYKVTAESSSGNVVLAQTFTSGLVTDVIFEEDENFAVVNGEKISISEITRVSINQ